MRRKKLLKSDSDKESPAAPAESRNQRIAAEDKEELKRQRYIDKELLLSLAKVHTGRAIGIIHTHMSRFQLKKAILIVFLLLLALLIITPIGTYLYFIRDFSSKENIMNRKNAGVVLVDRNDKPFFTFYEAKSKETATIDQIPDHTEQAVIAVEDKDFYEHPGFSIRSIGRAIITDIKEESLRQGGSTISQQLIKNTLLNQNKSFLRKYQEIVLALELERRFSKKDILEMYLNTVYFGEGAFGIEDAAQTYFSKSASELTLAESALLAGILPAPSAYSPLSGDKNTAIKRQRLVLSLMRQQKYITPDQEQQALAEEIVFKPQLSDLNQTAPHFALMVKDSLIKEYGEQTIAQSGYTVKTTLDLEDQKFAEQTVKNQVLRLQRNKVTNGASVAIEPTTGAILALVGSYDWNDENNGKINMVLRPRQPGSSFKPFVYAKAFETRTLTPGSIIDDKEVTFPGGYKPKNYDGKFRGPVTVRRALANSLNIPAVLALEKIGVPAGVEMAERLGVTTLEDTSQYGLSLALGAAEIPLLEMTGGFATFANSGIRNELYTIEEITDKNGTVIFTHKQSSRSIFGSDIAFLISSILSDNSARAEVFGGSLTISRPAAVKTGTTEDYRDSLTIGYTPSLVVGVWVGNNDRTPMDNVAGSSGAAPIWRLMMEHMLAGTPAQRFIQPADITKLMICKENGLKTTVATSSAYEEFFIEGTEPTKDCGISITPSQSPSETPEPSDQPEPTDTPEPTDQPDPTDIPQPTVAPTNFLLPTIQ